LTNGDVTRDMRRHVTRDMQRFHALGLFPTWWDMTCAKKQETM